VAVVSPRRRLRSAGTWERRTFRATVALSSRVRLGLPAALHAGFVARPVELTAQLDEFLARQAVFLLVTGTQVVNPLLAVSLLAFDVV
jgi:hypothetical protein